MGGEVSVTFKQIFIFILFWIVVDTFSLSWASLLSRTVARDIFEFAVFFFLHPCYLCLERDTERIFQKLFAKEHLVSDVISIFLMENVILSQTWSSWCILRTFFPNWISDWFKLLLICLWISRSNWIKIQVYSIYYSPLYCSHSKWLALLKIKSNLFHGWNLYMLNRNLIQFLLDTLTRNYARKNPT